MNEREVTLTADFKRRLFEAGRARNAAKDPSRTRRAGEVFDDAQLDCLGMIGEGAASIHLGIELNWEVTPGGDDGVDFVLPSGMTVGVKFNHRHRGYLMIEGRHGDTDAHLNDLKTDALLLIYGPCRPPAECSCDLLLNPDVSSVVTVGGWVTRPRFLAMRASKDWGLGLRHYVPPSRLNRLPLRPAVDAWLRGRCARGA